MARPATTGRGGVNAPAALVAADGRWLSRNGGCVEVLAIGNAARPAQAVRRLATIAALLRRRGVLGAAVLTEAATGRTVATRRIWP